MKKLLWVGDGPDCPSGFGRVTREVLAVLSQHYDVTVLGINHRGDPSTVSYPVYAAAVEGDAMGINRLIWMCDLVQPDVIVLQNDGWHIPYYMSRLRQRKGNGEYAFPEHAAVPVVAAVAVDGKNFQGEWLRGVTHAIFWTQFALNEAAAGGYSGPASVIPLGVDTENYRPMDKLDARLRRGLPREMDDAFIVGNVNRNQARKRWDLTIKYFAEWVAQKNLADAWLYLHTAPTGDSGPDIKQLGRYYGIHDRIALAAPDTWYGVSEEVMRDTYNCFDVAISTTQGEGFGLTALEAMACGVPCILPDWAALGDWAKGAAWLVPCPTTAINPVQPGLNVIGGVPDQKAFTAALNAMYTSREARVQNGLAALERAREPRFQWANIGQRYVETLDVVLNKTPVQEPVKVGA